MGKEQGIKIAGDGYLTAGQQFVIKTQERQKKLFINSPIIKSVLIISLPSMIIALMTSLYIFSDQIIMANLIPNFKPFENLVGPDYQKFLEYVTKLNGTGIGLNLTLYNSQLIVRNAVANSAPITVLINAATLLVANGTSTNFSKMNGKLNTKGAQKVWSIGFYCNIIVSVITMIFLFSVCQLLVQLENGDPLKQLTNASSSIKQACQIAGLNFDYVYPLIEHVYTKANDMIMSYSCNYSYIIISGAMLSMFSAYLSLLIISEGKQKMVVIAAVVSNLLNLLLDFIFIYYARMAMIGGAIATLIGWTLNCSWYFFQIHLMNKRNETALAYSSLKIWGHNWNWKLTWNIISIGLPSFLRNLSMGIAVWFQVFVLSTLLIPAIGSSGVTANDYTNFYGAVNPIYNLFFPVMLGTIQGSRIMCSYLYGAENYKRFRLTYWIAMIISLIYGTLIFAIVGCALNKYMLLIFQIHNNSIAQMMLMIATLQMPVYAFTVGGQVVFQATGKSLNASICALMQGIVCNIPITFIMFGICLANGNVELFLWNPVIVVFTSSIIIFVWTVIYICNHYSPDIINEKVRWLKKKGYLKPIKK